MAMTCQSTVDVTARSDGRHQRTRRNAQCRAAIDQVITGLLRQARIGCAIRLGVQRRIVGRCIRVVVAAGDDGGRAIRIGLIVFAQNIDCQLAVWRPPQLGSIGLVVDVVARAVIEHMLDESISAVGLEAEPRRQRVAQRDVDRTLGIEPRIVAGACLNVAAEVRTGRGGR